jgi:hypothetical protein
VTSVAINVTASTVLSITYKDKVFESVVIVSVLVETCIVRSLDWMSLSGVCGILHLMPVHCGTREFSPLGPKLQPDNRRTFVLLRKTIGTEVCQEYVRLNFNLQAEILTVSNLYVIHPRCVRCIQVKSKDSQVKTQLVLWIFVLFKVTR